MVLPIHIVIPIIIIIISRVVLDVCIFLNVAIDYMYCCPVCTCTLPLFLLTFLLSCRQCVRGCGQFQVGGAPTTDKEDYYKCPI